MKLTARTILITGGATGIGFALAGRLAARNNRVIICGRNETALLKAQAEEPALLIRRCDITDNASRRAMVDWINAEHPELDVVINNAGAQYRRLLAEDGALENLEAEVATNVTAPIRLIGELLPLLKGQANAAIINVTSALAFAPLADVPVYCATKAAMHSFTISLRHQLRTTRICVVEIAPPIVDTSLGGADRSAGTTGQVMMSPEDFATEALSQLETNQNEVLVGLAAGARKMGEALFERMNGP